MPAYDPAIVAALANDDDTRILTDSAATTLAEQFPHLDSDVVWEVLARLGAPECTFYKTVSSKHDPNDLLDVYHVFVDGVAVEIYLKFKVIAIPAGTMNQIVAVLSFKKK